VGETRNGRVLKHVCEKGGGGPTPCPSLFGVVTRRLGRGGAGAVRGLACKLSDQENVTFFKGKGKVTGPLVLSGLKVQGAVGLGGGLRRIRGREESNATSYLINCKSKKGGGERRAKISIRKAIMKAGIRVYKMQSRGSKANRNSTDLHRG